MIRVLVLDDDPEVRYGIYDYLKRDYEIYVTKKENEVFNILNQTNITIARYVMLFPVADFLLVLERIP